MITAVLLSQPGARPHAKHKPRICSPVKLNVLVQKPVSIPLAQQPPTRLKEREVRWSPFAVVAAMPHGTAGRRGGQISPVALNSSSMAGRSPRNRLVASGIFMASAAASFVFTRLCQVKMDEGVPPVPGPKLYPFKDGDGPLEIKWLRSIGRGVHARIWAVLINGKLYALKVFNFRRRYTAPTRWDVKVSKQEEAAYFDPFSCECRAYGRIREEGLEQYVVQCHGYIKLARSDFKPLLDDPKKWEERLGYQERHKGRPFRVLVKEFVRTDPNRHPPLPGHSLDNVRMTNKIFRDASDGKRVVRGLKSLQKSGIWIRDINTCNVVNGRFLDFSTAWTVPHPVMVQEKMEDERIMTYRDGGVRDAFQLDELIDVWNEEHAPSLKIWDRCIRSFDYYRRLRDRGCLRPGIVSGPNLSQEYKARKWRARPELYRWQNGEDKTDEVQTAGDSRQ
ncbi:hypothetical protein PG997_010052 [Apiospora hydei]|uniref:Protein kinase domain-containing protein n=1 Tax=Apiospora hydei TaxID=1337664 RepID=A0ABR1VVX6_9PEZI